MSAKKQKRPRDINIRAASTVALATGQETQTELLPEEVAEPTPEERHAAAVTLGKKGGQVRARRLPSEQRKKIAQKAALARWSRMD